LYILHFSIQFQQQQQQAAGGLQIVQQVVGPDGQIQQIPIQLSANQLQMLRMQLQANQANPQQTQGPLIIQTSPVQQGQTTAVMTTNANGTQIIQSS
jgi:nuclear transcription factor Y gamma